MVEWVGVKIDEHAHQQSTSIGELGTCKKGLIYEEGCTFTGGNDSWNWFIQWFYDKKIRYGRLHPNLSWDKSP